MSRQSDYFTMQTEFNPDDIKPRNAGPALTERICNRRFTPAELEEAELYFADYIQREEEMKHNFDNGLIETV